MPKAPLAKEEADLEDMMCQTFMAGCNGTYPQSHSDVEWGIRALMKMFECKRLPIARELKYEEQYEEHGPMRRTTE